MGSLDSCSPSALPLGMPHCHPDVSWGTGQLLAHPVTYPGSLGAATYVEDVSGGRQRELGPADDEGDGGQALHGAAVDHKLGDRKARL